MRQPYRASSHRFRPAFSDLTREVSPEAIDPEPGAFMANVYAALVQQVFDIAKREREPDVHQHA